MQIFEENKTISHLYDCQKMLILSLGNLFLREIQEMKSSLEFHRMTERDMMGWKEEYFSHNDVINVGH